MEARECQTFLVHSRKEIEKKIDKFYGHVLVLTLGAFAFFLKQSWRSFTEFGVALVRIKLCIHAREKIAFYCRKLCKSNQGSAHVLLSDE